jgi:hypothetical protein
VGRKKCKNRQRKACVLSVVCGPEQIECCKIEKCGVPWTTFGLSVFSSLTRTLNCLGGSQIVGDCGSNKQTCHTTIPNHTAIRIQYGCNRDRLSDAWFASCSLYGSHYTLPTWKRQTARSDSSLKLVLMSPPSSLRRCCVASRSRSAQFQGATLYKMPRLQIRSAPRCDSATQGLRRAVLTHRERRKRKGRRGNITVSARGSAEAPRSSPIVLGGGGVGE